LVEAGQVAAAEKPAAGSSDQSLRRVHLAALAEVGWNGAVLHRELVGLGFTGGYLQVQRFLQPYRAQRNRSELAIVRFETEPGEQAQIDYGQLQVFIGEQPETVHLFVFMLGYSRRLFARAYPNERLTSLLDGHERAFRWFGGVTLTCLYDILIPTGRPGFDGMGWRAGREFIQF